MIMIFIIVSASIKVFSQDCKSQFEVHAGADIDVCETGSVILDGYIGGDANRVFWQGGKGNFIPNRHTLNVEYVPDPSETGTTVLLMLVADNPDLKDCPAVRDTEEIRVNSQPKPHAGSSQKICGEQKVIMHGSVEGKAKEITWKTTGSGSFDMPHLLGATYSPSEDDIRKGGCTLYLVVQPFGFCASDSDGLSLAIDPAPHFTVVEDVKGVSGQPVSLSVKVNGKRGKMEWSTQGSGRFTHIDQEDTEYLLSAADLKNSIVKVSVTVYSSGGNCPVTKNITVHINQSSGN